MSSTVDLPIAAGKGNLALQPSHVEGSHPGAANIAVAALATFVGFCLMAAILHFCIRNPLNLYAEIRSEKLAILEQWTGLASSAAFGSSHTDTGFDPRVFDAEMHGVSTSTTTINLGISGGSQVEQAVVAEAFIDSLAASTQNSVPRFVLLEMTASANFTKEHLFHPRAINIYDLRKVGLALTFADRNHIGLRRAFGRSSFAFVAGLLHYMNVGMISSMIFSAPLNPQLMANQTGGDRRGLTPIEMAPQGSRDWLANQKILSVEHSPQPTPGEVVEGHRAILRELAEKAMQKHVQFVYFVAPRLDNLDTYPTFPESIEGPAGPVLILNVGLPRAHPELYRANMWHDPTHLTGAGAALFSKLLAEDLKGKLDQTSRLGIPRSEIAIH